MLHKINISIYLINIYYIFKIKDYKHPLDLSQIKRHLCIMEKKKHSKILYKKVIVHIQHVEQYCFSILSCQFVNKKFFFQYDGFSNTFT